MAMNAQQIQTELQRKKNLGIAPTDSANLGQYSKLPAAPKPMSAAQAPPAGQMGTRQYLQNQGVNNADIGFNNGQVTVNGMGFMSPSSNVNGQSFATKDSLDNAWRQYQMNQGQQKVNGFMNDYEKAIGTPYASFTPAQPFAYNKDADQAYQAALQSAMAGAQTAQNNAMVGLGARGIGNSSSAVTAANQIQQNALGAVTRDVLPQLISQAYQRYADAENQRYQQYSDQYSMSRDHIGDIGNLIGLQSGQNQSMTAEDQRAILNAMSNKQGNLDAAMQFSALTGKVLSPQSDWSGLLNQLASGKDSSGRPLQNTVAGNQVAYQQARDAITDQQWQQKFDQDVRQYGLDYGMQQLQMTNDEAYRQAQLALSQDQNDLAWLSADNKAAQNSSQYNGLSASQVLDSLKQRFYLPNSNERVAGLTPDKVYNTVVGFGLPDGQDDQVMIALGLTKQQIADLDKKYMGN